MTQPRFMRLPHTRLTDTLLIVAASFSGCGERVTPLPTTYPVRGKVAYQEGKPVANATVRFHPESEPRVVTSAVTGSDGAYTLVTKRDGLRADGAVAGPNQVTVLYTHNAGGSPPVKSMAGQQQMGFLSTDFPTPYAVQPRDNEINLTVERPR